MATLTIFETTVLAKLYYVQNENPSQKSAVAEQKLHILQVLLCFLDNLQRSWRRVVSKDYIFYASLPVSRLLSPISTFDTWVAA